MGREQKLDQLRTFLREAAETAQLLRQLLEDPQMRRIADEICLPYPDFDPYLSLTASLQYSGRQFLGEQLLLARLSAPRPAAGSLVRCEEGEDSAMDCVLYLSRTRGSYFRCLHETPHCYDLNGQALGECP
jgi:hypothetical protein